MGQIFNIRDENGEEYEAELLSVVEIDGKRYAVYTIECKTKDTVDIMASYVVIDENGYDKLVDIDDDGDREKVQNYINQLLEECEE